MHKFLKILLSGILTPFLFSCGKHKAESELNFGLERYDSTALHLALMTNRECLPILYAERTGIYDSLGLKLQVALYSSQTDCDTALLGKMADGGCADLIRMETYGNRTRNLRVAWKGGDKRYLFVSNVLRIKSIKALKGRTVGLSPRSADNNMLDRVLSSHSLGKNDVFRPQIADIRYREAMLTDNQIDATILTWPYTSQAYADGHRCIYIQKDSEPHTAILTRLPQKESLRLLKQWKLLETGRQMAIDSIRNPRYRAKVSLILQKDYRLPKSIADTIRLPF